MAGEELLLGVNPLLAIASGFEFVLSRGGLEGPRVTGDPGEIIPYSVGPAVSMADAMAAYSTAYGSVDPYYQPYPVDVPAQQTAPPTFSFDPIPGQPVGPAPVPGQFPTVPGQPTIPGGAPPPAFPPLEGMRPGGALPPDAEFTIPADPPPWWMRVGLGLGGLFWPTDIGDRNWNPFELPSPEGPPLPDTLFPDEEFSEMNRQRNEQLDTVYPDDWFDREAAKELARQSAAMEAAEAEFRRATAAAEAAARQPAPAPTPVPSLRTRLWPWIGLGLGVAGLASSRGSASPVPQYSPASFVDPITAGNTAAVSYASPAPSGAGSWGSGWGSQTCEPAKRGPRRKCLERAAVKWSGGRRKGKAAGSKCLRFSARKA